MNKVTLIGRITRDPELRYAASSNTPMLMFTLAVDRRYLKEGEERQTDYVSCKAFGKTAEFISKYFPKGRQMALSGRIQTGSYDKDGQKVYTTDVITEDVYFTGSKKDSEGSSYDSFESQSGSDAGFTAIDNADDQLPF